MLEDKVIIKTEGYLKPVPQTPLGDTTKYPNSIAEHRAKERERLINDLEKVSESTNKKNKAFTELLKSAGEQKRKSIEKSVNKEIETAKAKAEAEARVRARKEYGVARESAITNAYKNLLKSIGK